MEASETNPRTDATPSKRKRIEAWLSRERPQRITRANWSALLAEHAPISESYLRTLLRDSGVPLDPVVDGVRQESFDALEESLRALATVYEAAKASGDSETASASRKAVISAKDHARWAAARAKSAEKKSAKEEMAAWMLVWLENPPLFAAWARVRRAAMATEVRSIPPE